MKPTIRRKSKDGEQSSHWWCCLNPWTQQPAWRRVSFGFLISWVNTSQCPKKKKGYICWNLVSVACNKKMFWRIHVTARKVWPTSSSVAECILMNFKNAFFQRGLIWATVASGLTKTFLSFEQLHTWCWIAGWGGGGWGVNKTVPEHGTHFTASFMWGREIPCYHKK